MGFRPGPSPRDAVHAADSAGGHPGLHHGQRRHDRHSVPRYGARSDQGLALGRHHPAQPRPAGTGYVHYGFAEALDSIFPTVRDTLAELRTNGQSVWFTGHSLGGAPAMLAGARMYLEEPRLAADGVYTYGQPRTCDRLLAAAYNKGFKNRTYRFVNDNDIVPQLPPEPAYTQGAALHRLPRPGPRDDAADRSSHRLRTTRTTLVQLVPQPLRVRKRLKGEPGAAVAPRSD